MTWPVFWVLSMEALPFGGVVRTEEAAVEMGFPTGAAAAAKAGASPSRAAARWFEVIKPRHPRLRGEDAYPVVRGVETQWAR